MPSEIDPEWWEKNFSSTDLPFNNWRLAHNLAWNATPDIDFDVSSPQRRGGTIAQYDPYLHEITAFPGSIYNWASQNAERAGTGDQDEKAEQDFIGGEMAFLPRILSHEVMHGLTRDQSMGAEGTYGGGNLRRNQFFLGKPNTPTDRDFREAAKTTATIEHPAYQGQFPESSLVAHKGLLRQVIGMLLSSSTGASGRIFGVTRREHKKVVDNLPKGLRDIHEIIGHVENKYSTSSLEEKEQKFRELMGVRARGRRGNFGNTNIEDMESAIGRERAHDSRMKTARKKGWNIPELLSGKKKRGAQHLGSRFSYKMTGKPMDIAFQLLKNEDRTFNEYGEFRDEMLRNWFDVGDTWANYDDMNERQQGVADAAMNLPLTYLGEEEWDSEELAPLFGSEHQNFTDDDYDRANRFLGHLRNGIINTMDDPQRNRDYDFMSDWEHPEHPVAYAKGMVAKEDYTAWQQKNAGEPIDIAFQLLKERKSPEAWAHKLEYDKKYQKTPKRVKYREQLNAERRKRGIYGSGGSDVSHTQGGKLTLESPHSNRARHFKGKGTLRRSGYGKVKVK